MPYLIKRCGSNGIVSLYLVTTNTCNDVEDLQVLLIIVMIIKSRRKSLNTWSPTVKENQTSISIYIYFLFQKYI